MGPKHPRWDTHRTQRRAVDVAVGIVERRGGRWKIEFLHVLVLDHDERDVVGVRIVGNLVGWMSLPSPQDSGSPAVES